MWTRPEKERRARQRTFQGMTSTVGRHESCGISNVIGGEVDRRWGYLLIASFISRLFARNAVGAVIIFIHA
jgi:hypothetical protein